MFLALLQRMSRIPRNLILDDGFQTHKMWRSHNNEKNLLSSNKKAIYIDILNKELGKKEQTNNWQ